MTVVSLLGVGDFAGLTRIEPVLLDGAAECGLRSSSRWAASSGTRHRRPGDFS